MQIDLDMGDGQNQIRGLGKGQIKINDTVWQQNVIVAPDQILPWAAKDTQSLTRTHVETLMELQPAIVLIGTGERPSLPQPWLIEALQTRQIGIEMMTTAAACRTYNVIMAEGRYVVAALIVD
jgi:uncharacterized protein